MYPRSRDRRRRQRGNIALLTALMITMLIAFVALSFDVGNMYRVKNETQVALDAAALAGAMAFGSGNANVQAAAVAKANQHFANTGNLTLTTGDVSLGVWDNVSSVFLSAVPAGGSPNRYISAVQVTYGQSVSTPFAGVGGTRQVNVGARAIAMRGGPVRATCAFPLVISDAALANASQTNCNVCLQLLSNQNNSGWTSFTNNVNPNTIRTALATACFTDSTASTPAVDANGACAGSCTSGVTVNQSIPVNNGNNMGTGSNNFCPLISALLLRTGTPTPFTVDVSVIGGATFTGNQNVVGISRLSVYGVRCGPGNNNQVRVANMPSTACPGPNNNLYVQVALPRDANGNCDQSSRNMPGTGGYYGTYARPVLVQ